MKKKLTLEELALEVPVLSKILTRSLLGGSEYDAPEWIDLGDGMRGVVPEDDGGMLPEVVVEDERPGNNQGGLDIDINDGELIPPPNNDNPGSGGNNNDEDDRNGDNPNDPNDQDSPNEQGNDANEGQYDPNDEHEGRGGAGAFPATYVIPDLPTMEFQFAGTGVCAFNSLAYIATFITGQPHFSIEYAQDLMNMRNETNETKITTSAILNGSVPSPSYEEVKNILDKHNFSSIENGNIKNALENHNLCLGFLCTGTEIVDEQVVDITHAVVIVGYKDNDQNGTIDEYSYVDPHTPLEISHASTSEFDNTIFIVKQK